jgi:hypothetical protein
VCVNICHSQSGYDILRRTMKLRPAFVSLEIKLSVPKVFYEGQKGQNMSYTAQPLPDPHHGMNTELQHMNTLVCIQYSLF